MKYEQLSYLALGGVNRMHVSESGRYKGTDNTYTPNLLCEAVSVQGRGVGTSSDGLREGQGGTYTLFSYQDLA